MGTINNPYIPWNVDYLYRAIEDFRFNIGSGVNIGLWIFFIAAGVILCAALVRNLAS